MAGRRILKIVVRHILRLQQCHFLDYPILIVACGRSGATALFKALGEHQNILMADDENPFVHRFGQLAYDYAFSEKHQYYQATIQLTTEQFRNTLKEVCFTGVFGIVLGFSYHPRNFKKKHFALRRGRSIRYWGTKAFPDKNAAEGLLWLYPHTKFIYIFRNGLDVVHSMSHFPYFQDLCFETRCHLWADRVFEYDYLRHHERAITVRFEEFLSDNSSVFQKIYSHLGVPSDSGPSAYASSTLVHPFGNRNNRHAEPREAFRDRKPGYIEWSENEKETFKRVCMEAMQLLDYEVPF